MAGLIRKDDIEAVRNAVKIDEIIGEHVALRPAGIGSLKGLCPFHDERTPSFNVRPHLGMFHCFGCGESGDVISFVQKIDHLPFTEAVEMLAAKAGITLHYEEGGARVRTEEPGKRQRLLDAHRVAEEFYQQQLASPEAHKGRTFLAERGFTQAMCAHFGVGYAPASWDSLTRHLRSKGFTDQEIQIAGLGSQGNRGVYDRFRGRLVWPIRDITGATVGFGARRLDDSDKESPKYLNTPETPIYKKSQLLYGLDLAKKTITTEHKVVIVEGYTDVMAAHVAGRDERRGHVWHRFWLRACEDHLPPARRPRGSGRRRAPVHGARARLRGHLHLRRRQCREKSRAARLRRGSEFRGPDLRGGGAGRPGPL